MLAASPFRRVASVDAGRGPGPNEAGIIDDVQIVLPALDLIHRVLVIIDWNSLESAIGHEVDGIIGSGLFHNFIVLVDYQHASMSVYSPAQYHPSANEKPLPARVDRHGFQFIEATVALPGVAPITGEYLTDSGANIYLEIYNHFAMSTIVRGKSRFHVNLQLRPLL